MNVIKRMTNANWFRYLCITILAAGMTILVVHFVIPPAKPLLNAGKAKAAGAAKMDMKLVAIGDSLTEGVGDDTHNGGYVPLLASGLDDVCHFRSIETFNYGKSGNRTTQVTARIQESKEIQNGLKNADAIVITIGANDLLKVAKDNIFKNLSVETFTKPRDEYIKNITTMYQEIRKYNPTCPIYQLGIYNPFYYNFKDITELQSIIDLWNQTTMEFVEKEKNVHFVPINDLIYQGNEDGEKQSDVNNLLSEADSFHPNNTGYQIIANTFRDEMLKTQKLWIRKK